jgi:hypothetical protein
MRLVPLHDKGLHPSGKGNQPSLASVCDDAASAAQLLAEFLAFCGRSVHRLCRNSFLDGLNLTHMATTGLEHHSFAKAVRIKCDGVTIGSSVEKHPHTKIVLGMRDRKSRKRGEALTLQVGFTITQSRSRRGS